jgi:hypothetical protein
MITTAFIGLTSTMCKKKGNFATGEERIEGETVCQDKERGGRGADQKEAASWGRVYA